MEQSKTPLLFEQRGWLKISSALFSGKDDGVLKSPFPLIGS
jgi:hypothetical protein